MAKITEHSRFEGQEKSEMTGNISNITTTKLMNLMICIYTQLKPCTSVLCHEHRVMTIKNSVHFNTEACYI